MGPGGGWELCRDKLGDAGMSAVTRTQRPTEMLMGGDTCHPRGPQNQGLVTLEIFCKNVAYVG